MSDDTLELLKRVAKDVADIKAAMAASVGASAAALGVSAGGGGGSSPGGVASAAELDGQYGDPQIKKDPPRWSGDSFVGKTFSETTPEYLDCVASFKDWLADKDDAADAKDAKGKPKSYWPRKDARLARGWSTRLRSGWKPANGGSGGAPQPKEEDYGDGGFGDGGGGGDSEIPF